MNKRLIRALGLAMGITAIGCTDLSSTIPPSTPAQPSRINAEVAKFRVPSAAGVDLTPEPPPGGPLWVDLTTKRVFSTRPDPFALQSKERSFDTQQTTERVFSNDPWRINFEPQEETIILPTPEPQPYRRLAGVIVGDSVLALIDMGDGQQLQLIHPGQVINGWTVVSIDSEKAILRRGGNLLPHEITVRLEEPPNGFRGGGGSNPGNNPGGNGPTPGTQGGGTRPNQGTKD